MGGFSIVPLAQKARTKTLIADSDLNLGSYDLIATDVKGDTAEFSEFVGGVGNFSNVLGSGNLDIEGTASIKGNTQIDGNLVLDGAINNVNITSDGNINSVGTITASGVINANGGIIGNLTGKINVNPTTTNTGLAVGSYNVSIAQRNLTSNIPTTRTITENYSMFPLNLDMCTYSLTISIGSNTTPSYSFTFTFTVNNIVIHTETISISGLDSTKSFTVDNIPLNGDLIITCSSSSGSHYIKATSASGTLYLS